MTHIEIILGAAEDIEAEYGCSAPSGEPFCVVQLWDGHFGSVEGFQTVAVAKDAYSWGTQHDDGNTYSYLRL